MDARALAVGRDLYFSSGAYAPAVPEGQATLAHELQHAAQFDRGELPSPGQSLALAAPEGPAEREAHAVAGGNLEGVPRAHTASAGTGPATLVLAIPRDLPQTAGGFRLGRDLTGGPGTEIWEQLWELFSLGDLEGIDAYYRAERGSAAAEVSFEDLLGETWDQTSPRLTELRNPLRADLEDAFWSDLSTLVWEEFSVDELDGEALRTRFVQVGATYRNLVELHAFERQNPDVVPPGGEALGDWFRSRAQIFLDFATRTDDAAAYADMLVALAAETARLAEADPRGPVDTARILVGTLIDRGISEATVQHLSDLYRDVIYDLPIDLTAPDAGAIFEYPEQLATALEQDVLGAEQVLRDRGDDDAVERFHRRLRDLIATFLATLREGPDTSDRMASHLDALYELLADFGFGNAVMVVVVWFNDAVWPQGRPGDEAQAPEEQPAEDEEETWAAPVPEPSRARISPPEAPEPPLPSEYLTSADLEAWIRSYWEDRNAFYARRFSAGALLRGMGPPTPVITEQQAVGRIAFFRRLVIAILARLDRHLLSAAQRAQTIHERRAETFALSFDESPPGVDDPFAIAEPPPDYVSYFGLPSEAWYLLREALEEERFDGELFQSQLLFSFSEYFEAHGLYQRNLIRALGLTAQLRTHGADQLIIEDFPDDYGPAVRRILAVAETSPAWTTRSEDLESAVGLDYTLSRIAEVAERADLTLRLRREQALEAEINHAFRLVVADLWTEQDAAGEARSEVVPLSRVWPDRLKRFVTIPDELLTHAELFAERARRQFNEGTLTSLALEAGQAAEDVDTPKIAELISRIGALQRDLGTGRLDASVEALRQYNLAQSEDLLRLFVSAQTQLSLKVDHRRPGHIARTGRLLQRVMHRRGYTTLAEVVASLQDLNGQLTAYGIIAEDFQGWIEGTQLSSLFDTVATGLGGSAEILDILAEIAADAENPNTVLWHLLQVEASASEARKWALNDLGDFLAEQDTTGCFIAARLSYATALGVSDRIHEALKPKEVVEAETRLNQRHVSSGEGNTDPLERPAATEEERADVRVIQEYRTRSEEVQAQLDRDEHPARGDALTDAERHAWEEYKDISGRGRLLGGEQDWSEFWDFAEELAFVATVGVATGGSGAFVAEALGGSALVGLGVTALEVGAITGATRLRQTLTTGVDPQTWFLEDFVVNAASMGLGNAAAGAYASAFRLSPGTAAAGLRRHVLGRITAEYVATSVLTRAHLSISSQLHGTPLTDEEVRQAYLTNGAFLVAFKARDLLGRPRTHQMEHDLGDAAAAHRRLLDRLSTQDALIDQAAQDARTARNQVEREAALQAQEAALAEKARLLRESPAPELREAGQDYGDAVSLYRAEAARARVFGLVNVEPVRGSRDLTYSRGAASERALTEHLNDSGTTFQVLEGLHGRIFELDTPDGPIRISPREAQLAGGTSARTFAPVGRIEEEPLRSGDHDQLASILAADAQLNADVRRALRAQGHAFELTRAGVAIDVRLMLVDSFSSDQAGHAPGPAQYRISWVDGKLQVTIEAVTSATNDQLGRAVDHEMREVGLLVDALVRDAAAANEPLSRYEARSVLDSVLAREREAGILGGGAADRPTAHDIASLHELNYLSGKMRELEAALQSRPDPDTADQLRLRLDILEGEFRQAWRESGLSADPEVLQSQLQRFEDAGVSIQADLRTSVEEGSFAASQGWEARGGVRMIDLHIIYSELQRAHPNLMQGVTLADVTQYFNERIAGRADAVYDAELAASGNAELALARAVESVRAMLGPTSIPSLRGRAFEGLSADELNRSPNFRSQHGELHVLTNPSFPGFDAVSVRGTSRAVQIDETPRQNPDGSRTAQLRITDANGVTILHWLDGRPPTSTVAPGHDVRLWSAKARGSYEPGNLYRTVGSARTQHPDAQKLTTPEFLEAIRASIRWTQARIATLQGQVAAGDASAQADLTRMRTRLSDLQHFESRVRISERWTNARIDAILEDMRERGLNVDAILEGLYDRHAEETEE